MGSADELDLEGSEPGLGDGVVQARAGAAHRAAQPQPLAGGDAGGRGVFAQYLAIRYTDRLADAGAVTSVGSRGDSYDNALAERTIGLYKTELIRRRGPWRGLDGLELATLEWVDWYNHRRLHGALDHLPPAEHEAAHPTGDPDPTPALEGAAT